MKCSIIKIEESYGGPAVTDSGCEFDPIVALALLPHNGSKSFLKELSYLNVTKFSWRYFFLFFCTKVWYFVTIIVLTYCEKKLF